MKRCERCMTNKDKPENERDCVDHSCRKALESLEHMEATITHCGAKIEEYSNRWNTVLQRVEARQNDDAAKTSQHTNHNCLHCMVCMEPFPKQDDEENYILALGCGNAPSNAPPSPQSQQLANHMFLAQLSNLVVICAGHIFCAACVRQQSQCPFCRCLLVSKSKLFL
jgi:hypothetical protein